MLLKLLESRRVVFVGGKGGVGKTSVASAVGASFAEAGDRVLVVSTDPAHNLGHLWSTEIGDRPRRLLTADTGSLDGLEIDPEATVSRHFAAVGATMAELVPEHMQDAARRHLELARHAPGSHESAILDRISEVVADGFETYDRIVFDTAPSGHTVRLMALPGRLSTWTGELLANRDRSEKFASALHGLGGARARREDAHTRLRATLVRRQERFETLRRTLLDADRTAFVIVFTAEAMPVAETIELHGHLDALGIEVASLVANRRSPVDAGELLAGRRQAEDRFLDRVRSALPEVPITELPLLPSAATQRGELDGLIEQLRRG